MTYQHCANSVFLRFSINFYLIISRALQSLRIEMEHVVPSKNITLCMHEMR